MGEICFHNEGHFKQMAVHRIVQNWLREATEEEVAAASLTMNNELLKVINRKMTQLGRDSVKECLSLVNDENRQNLTDSFYHKLLKVLVDAADLDSNWDHESREDTLFTVS